MFRMSFYPTRPRLSPGWKAGIVGLLAGFGPMVNGALATEFVVAGRKTDAHAAKVPYAVTEPLPGQLRFEVRAGDRWTGDRARGADSERAELLVRGPVKFGKTYRVSYEMRIEMGPPVTSQWLLAGQWHATEDDGDAPSSPPLAFELHGSDFVVYTQSTTEPRHAKNPEGIERARVRGILRDRWYRVSYEMRFDPVRGYLKVTLDGRPIFAGDIPLGYADRIGPYFKLGIYRARSPETIAIRYRDVRIEEAR